MSSVVIIQQSDAVHLITDGAFYDRQAQITELRSKVMVLPLSNCAIATRGAAWPDRVLRFALSFAQTYDDAVDMIPTLMAAIIQEYDKFAAPDAPPESRNFEITLAGWSDQHQRMIAGVAATWQVRDENDVTGMSFMEGYQPGSVWIAAQGQAYPAVDIQAVLGRSLTVQSDIDALDPERDGFKLHEAQRREAGIYCGKAAYLVGGFAELTTIRRDGVERKTLREWPDAIGEKIVPEGAPPVEIAQAALDSTQRWQDARIAAFNIAKAA